MQDLPPPGGFPNAIRYQRFLPQRGPSGALIFMALAGIIGYGWYEFDGSLKEKKQLDVEKSWMRISLVPLLQAEMDRDMARRYDAAEKQEAEIMKNVPGWKAGDLKAPVAGIGSDPEALEPVYYTKKFIAPSLFVLPKESVIPAQPWRGSHMLYMNPPYHQREDFFDHPPIGHPPETVEK